VIGYTHAPEGVQLFLIASYNPLQRHTILHWIGRNLLCKTLTVCTRGRVPLCVEWHFTLHHGDFYWREMKAHHLLEISHNKVLWGTLYRFWLRCSPILQNMLWKHSAVSQTTTKYVLTDELGSICWVTETKPSQKTDIGSCISGASAVRSAGLCCVQETKIFGNIEENNLQEIC